MRASGVTCSTWCAIVETGDCAESASCVTGLVRNVLTSTLTPASRVAEKSIRWPTFGVTLLPNLPADNAQVFPALRPLHLLGSPTLLEQVA